METVNVGSHGRNRAQLGTLLIIFILLLGTVIGFATLRNDTGGDLLTYNLSEPLGGAATAKIEIDPGDGNLKIDPFTGGEQVLASGTLQYLESQGLPDRTMITFLDQATLTLKASSTQPTGFQLPWVACNGATEWQIQLNPNVASDITAHTDGGNVWLNLAGMVVTRLSADTGGGNMDVVLPDSMSNLSAAVTTGAGDVTVAIGSGITGSSTINASSGAGNVDVTVPDGIAARIHVTSGMGKVIVDGRFSKIDDTTYQTPDYESAADTIEITANSGAGNVSVNIQ